MPCRRGRWRTSSYARSTAGRAIGDQSAFTRGGQRHDVDAIQAVLALQNNRYDAGVGGMPQRVLAVSGWHHRLEMEAAGLTWQTARSLVVRSQAERRSSRRSRRQRGL
jgi:hypothetical protein